MPDGSQAWKMIRPPGTHVERIAQACDRCRSKKIKCDGNKPQCSQCKNVGFECRTSDKLSRRSFPRGYTESLENRVRELESMSKQLNREIDLKDEQLEMLAKVDAFSHRGHSEARRRSSSSPTRISNDDNDEEYVEKFTISECDLQGESFKGPSSGNYFFSLFLQKAGRKHPQLEGLLAGFNDCLNQEPLSSSACGTLYSTHNTAASLPSRLEADELVTTFFQYWHPFFPILHKPSFLEEYRLAYSDPRKADSEFLLKLYIILSISSTNRAAKFDYEARWRRLFDLNKLSPSIMNLQILLLVQLFSCLVGRSSDMYQYKCMAVGMAVRLGLHRCQKHFKISVMGSEIRRRLFWVTYVLDCFSSAAVGAPLLMNEKDIECVYPSDVDDEYITEATILSPAPGKFTQVSAFLGLVRGARVMSSILSLLYNSKKVQTFKVIMELEDLLEEWRSELPHHLKFEFSGGAPRGSVSGLHANAPLLLVLYHHMRLLIHRPAIATEGSRTAGSGSITKLMDSSKQIIQLASFLKSRRQRWTICLCEAQVLVMAGIGVLYLAMDYPRTGLLFKECSKSMGLCLDGIYEHPSFSESLYQHFEKLHDGIFGINDSSKDKNGHGDSKERRHHQKPTCSIEAPSKLPTPPGSDTSILCSRKLSQLSPESDDSSYKRPNIGCHVNTKPQMNITRNSGLLTESFVFDNIKSGLPSPEEEEEEDYGIGIPGNRQVSKQGNLDLDKYLPLFNMNQELSISGLDNAKKESHQAVVDFPALYVASDCDSNSNTENDQSNNEIPSWPTISGIDCDGPVPMVDDNYDTLFNNLWKGNDQGSSSSSLFI